MAAQLLRWRFGLLWRRCDDAGDATTIPSCFELVLQQSFPSSERALRRHRRAAMGRVAASRCYRRRRAAPPPLCCELMLRGHRSCYDGWRWSEPVLPAPPCRPPELLGAMVMAVLCGGKNRGREDYVDFYRRLGTPRSYGSADGCCFLLCIRMTPSRPLPQFMSFFYFLT